jgi:predicted Zn-dependent peptidase
MNLRLSLPLTLLVLALVLIFSPFSASAQKLPPPLDQLKFPSLSFQIPQTEKFRLRNGIRVHFLADREFPLVTVTALVRSGSLNDPAGLEGLAELTGSLLRTGGTKQFSLSALNEILDRTGTNLEVTVGREFTSITLSVLREHLEEGLKFLREIIENPLFDEGRVQMEKGLMQARIARIADMPDRLAFREFQKLLLRGSGREKFASVASVQKVEKKHILEFHANFYHPFNMALAVSGDIAPEEGEEILNRHLGSWEATSVKRPSPLAAIIPPPGERYLLNRQSPQSIIIAGWMAPPRAGDDYYPFVIADFLLGSGGFKSRIFSEVRSSRGLAYSAGSIYRARADHAIFMIYAMVDARNTLTTLNLLQEILSTFQNNPPTPEELQYAQNSINNSFIFSFDSSHEVVRSYLQLELDSLPLDYYATYRQRIEGVFPEEVQKLAQKYLSWDQATILVLGPEKDFGEFWQKMDKFKLINHVGNEKGL